MKGLLIINGLTLIGHFIMIGLSKEYNKAKVNIIGAFCNAIAFTYFLINI